MGPEHPVVKVHDKIFAFVGGERVGVKAGPTREVADEWIDRYPDDASVMAYIGRSGWNNLRYGGAIDDEELLRGGRRVLRLGGRQAGEEAPPAGLGGLSDDSATADIAADTRPQMRLGSGCGDVPHQARGRAARCQ